jgi:hypothetical protein
MRTLFCFGRGQTLGHECGPRCGGTIRAVRSEGRFRYCANFQSDIAALALPEGPGLVWTPTVRSSVLAQQGQDNLRFAEEDGSKSDER